jgi:hypothetical protein
VQSVVDRPQSALELAWGAFDRAQSPLDLRQCAFVRPPSLLGLAQGALDRLQSALDRAQSRLDRLQCALHPLWGALDLQSRAFERHESALRLHELALQPLELALRRAKLAFKLHGGTLLEELEDRKLIEGFLQKDRRLSALFVRLLLDAIRAEALRRWPSLQHRADEIESKALYLVVKWRDEGKPLADQTIAGLAGQLVNRAAVTERKAQKVEKKALAAAEADPQPGGATAEDEAVANDLAAKLWALSAGLKALPVRPAGARGGRARRAAHRRGVGH